MSMFYTGQSGMSSPVSSHLTRNLNKMKNTLCMCREKIFHMKGRQGQTSQGMESLLCLRSSEGAGKSDQSEVRRPEAGYDVRRKMGPGVRGLTGHGGLWLTVR